MDGVWSSQEFAPRFDLDNGEHRNGIAQNRQELTRIDIAVGVGAARGEAAAFPSFGLVKVR